MEDIQNKVFSDFEPPATTDGSHLGVMHHVKETQKHYDMKFEQELLKVNQRLKSSKTKVSLQAKKGGIQLRATLPLKPNDIHKQGRYKKQYTISLGIPASFDGLKTAEEEAQELGKLIARQTFVWTDKYLGVQASKDSKITFVELYEQFEKRYFEKRKRTLKSENTFTAYKGIFKSKFLSNDVITAANLKKIIAATETPSARTNVMVVCRVICNMLGITINLTDLVIKYVPKKREIPTDEVIIKSINKFQEHQSNIPKANKRYARVWKAHKTAYALLAIYGLRPREIYNHPDLDWLLSPQNKYHTFKVHESNKTGYREVFPFVPQWIELFDLKNFENINEFKKHVFANCSSKDLKTKVTGLAKKFSACKIPFTPYDLRHACAIRAHLQGMPIKAAADNLGHTVEIHTSTYQRWFGLENRRKAFEQTFDEVNENERLKYENAQLRKRNAELELEVSKLRLL